MQGSRDGGREKEKGKEGVRERVGKRPIEGESVCEKAENGRDTE